MFLRVTQNNKNNKMSTYIINEQGKGNVENVTPTTLVKISGNGGGSSGGDSNLTLEQARLNGNTVDDVILGSAEFDKQGDRKAFAQLSDVYDNVASKVLDTRDDSSKTFWTGSQAQYDMIVTKDPDTIYIIL